MVSPDSLTGELKKIMLFCFGGIGDVILFFPVIKTLHQLYPFSEITLVTEPRCKSVAEKNLLVKKVLTFDLKNKPSLKDFSKFIKELRREKADLALSMGSSMLVPVMLFLTGAKYRVGYATNKLKFLNTKSVPLNKQQYAAKMYFDLLKGVTIDVDILNPVPEMEIPEESKKWADELFENKKIEKSEKEKIVLIHPGASKISKIKKIIKTWEAHKWVQLIDLLLKNNLKVILAGGPDDEEDINFIRKHITAPKDNFINLYGETKNLEQLGALIQKSDLLVCVDSAPMNVGIAVKTPLVALFGPTDENKILPPNSEKFVPLRISLDCAPCLWEKRKTTCDKLTCMKNLEVEKVFSLVMKQLSISSEIQC